MKKSIKFIIVLLGLVSLKGLFAQFVNIPDPNFKSALVGNSSINTNLNGEIELLEASSYNGTIAVNNLSIADLTGIEAFTAIYYLDCNSNLLTSINLSANTGLTNLDCSYNQLTVLDVSANTSLTNLSFGDNLITSIDLSANTNLTDLSCTNNQLATLDVSANISLTNISCSNNLLSGISLPASSSLGNLYCGNNQLTTLDVSANSGLNTLVCGNNLLTNLDVSFNYSLTYLDCSNNQLTALNVAYNYSLNQLYCGYNNLACLDVSANPFLGYFVCNNNNLLGLNLQNGNNGGIIVFQAHNNPGLGCIKVDNGITAATNWSANVDGTASFDTACNVPVAQFNSNAPVCFGSPVAFTDLSSFAYWWNWDFGGCATSTLQSPSYTYATTGNYIVTLTASNCYGSGTYIDTIKMGMDISGHVGYSLGDVIAGFAVIHLYDTASHYSFDTTQISPLDGSGYYHFYNVPDGDYLIKVFANPFNYPTLSPTYYSNEWAWDSADVFLHGCIVSDTADIIMVESAGTGGGAGLLHGRIIEGNGFGRAPGGPINGVDVKLGVAGTSQIVASATTDINGGYTFSSVNLGTYTVYVDIPGLDRDSSYTVTVDPINNLYLNLNYTVDSVSIFIEPNIGVENVVSTENKFNVYPNPVIGNSIIEFTINDKANVKLDIYDVIGVKVQSFINTQLESGEYQFNFNPQNNHLKAGIYFISLSINGKICTMRVVVT